MTLDPNCIAAVTIKGLIRIVSKTTFRVLEMPHVCLWEFANLAIPRTRRHRLSHRRVICPSIGDSNLEDSVHDKEGIHHALEREEVVKEGPELHMEETELCHTSVRSVKYSELRGTPLSCGVESATTNFELPAPPAAARNLVGTKV